MKMNKTVRDLRKWLDWKKIFSRFSQYYFLSFSVALLLWCCWWWEKISSCIAFERCLRGSISAKKVVVAASRAQEKTWKKMKMCLWLFNYHKIYVFQPWVSENAFSIFTFLHKSLYAFVVPCRCRQHDTLKPLL